MFFDNKRQDTRAFFFLAACYLTTRLQMEMTRSTRPVFRRRCRSRPKTILFRINYEISRTCAAAFHAVRTSRTNNRPITGGPRACLSRVRFPVRARVISGRVRSPTRGTTPSIENSRERALSVSNMKANDSISAFR